MKEIKNTDVQNDIVRSTSLPLRVVTPLVSRWYVSFWLASVTAPLAPFEKGLKT